MLSFIALSNSNKLISGQLFAKRLRLAIAEREVQQESFEIFSSKQAERIDTWKAMVSAFEADGSKPNPYEIPSHGEFSSWLCSFLMHFVRDYGGGRSIAVSQVGIRGCWKGCSCIA